MARLIDGKGLFDSAFGRIGTTGDVHCDWCGKTYTGREDNDGESIEIARFGELQVLDCCFGKVEDAVLENIGDIIPWMIKVLEQQQRYVDRNKGELMKLATAIVRIGSCKSA